LKLSRCKTNTTKRLHGVWVIFNIYELCSTTSVWVIFEEVRVWFCLVLLFVGYGSVLFWWCEYKKEKKRETEHKYTTFLVQLTIVMITITREALHYTTLFQFTHIQVTMKHICLATILFVKIINIYNFIQLWFHTNNL